MEIKMLLMTPPERNSASVSRIDLKAAWLGFFGSNRPSFVFAIQFFLAASLIAIRCFLRNIIFPNTVNHPACYVFSNEIADSRQRFIGKFLESVCVHSLTL